MVKLLQIYLLKVSFNWLQICIFLEYDSFQMILPRRKCCVICFESNTVVYLTICVLKKCFLLMYGNTKSNYISTQQRKKSFVLRRRQQLEHDLSININFKYLRGKTGLEKLKLVKKCIFQFKRSCFGTDISWEINHFWARCQQYLTPPLSLALHSRRCRQARVRN